jgi:hypothetical protein
MTVEHCKIKNIYTHPGYRGQQDSDSGLIELTRPAESSVSIQPVKLARTRIKLTSSYIYIALRWSKIMTEEYPLFLK